MRPDAQAAVDLVARLLADRLRADPALTLGLATGRTMERLYARLAAEPDLSFARVTAFALDEYVGLGADDPRSYRSYLDEHVVARTDLDPARLHVPDGGAADLVAAATAHERAIAEAGGIGFQLLGIGRAGHIGFNEPLSAIMSRTRDKSLTPTTRRQNAPMFGDDPQAVPARALTMGIATILEAREICLLATGAEKAEVLARAVEGPVTSMISASALQLHPNVKVVVDEAAGARLEGREYYDFVFEHEPDWAAYRDG